MSDYDTDILTWSERQAELLRRRAAGELVNEADLDWPNIAEEIESLGKTVARELAGRVSAILIHLIKLEGSHGVGCWYRLSRTPVTQGGYHGRGGV